MNKSNQNKTQSCKPFLKYYIPSYKKNNTVIIQDYKNVLSIAIDTVQEGELYVDKGIYFATQMQLPLREKIQWKVNDDYLCFYKKINKPNKTKTWLKKKCWGYQTVCPDEENQRGYYQPVSFGNVAFYENPSFDAEEISHPQQYSYWGWDIFKDAKTRTTWTKVSQDEDIWVPIDTPFYIDE
tara:strand:- start:809 stop:1354 length:546 start_codon:yes stop_codon:yes gene_type:complete